MTEEDTKWLNEQETRTWLAFWSVSEWTPTRLDEQLKRDMGINLHDYFALAQISMAPDERITMSQLAAVSDMSPSRLSHVVSRLEKRGWVTRTASQLDKRTNIAGLTDSGRAFIQKAAPGHVTRARELIFDPLTDEEVETLGEIMNKILTKLDPPELPRV